MSKKINSLQLLRTIAVALVIFLHATGDANLISHNNFPNSFYSLNTWGALGVDLFFNISGFIMTIVTPAYQISGGCKDFLLKRIIRIVPLYYLITCYDVVTAVWIHHNQKFSWMVLAKSLLFIPVFDTVHFIKPYVGVGWSLSYEIYFYLLIGILLIFRKKLNQRLLIIILILSVIGTLINPGNVLLKFITSPILLEFSLGILAGVTYQYVAPKILTIKNIRVWSLLLLSLGVILLCASIFIAPTYNNRLLAPQEVLENNNIAALYRAFFWGVPCCIFLMGVVLWEKSFNVAIWGILILCGDASYSCYLIHSHLYPVIAKIFSHLPAGIAVNLYLIMVVPLCLGISILFYIIVEKSLTNWAYKGMRFVLKS
jgi:exopolysaccharide production protein ExoZ